MTSIGDDLVPTEDQVPPAGSPSRRANRMERQGAASPARLGPSVTALDIWSFAVPAVSFVQINVVGNLMASEILMLVMLPWLWGIRGRPAMPRYLVVLWAGWLMSQIATDMVVGSAPADFARGWAAITFGLTNFAAIVVLSSTPGRARLFALGLALSGLLGYVFYPDVYAVSDPWKWALATPIGLIVLAGLSGSAGGRWPWVRVAVIGLFGVLNLLLGARSYGGLMLFTACYLVIGALGGRRSGNQRPSFVRAVAGLVFLVMVVVGVLQGYDVAASEGWLGQAAQTKYYSQSGEFGVLLGGRSEVLASSQAIIRFPDTWSRIMGQGL